MIKSLPIRSLRFLALALGSAAILASHLQAQTNTNLYYDANGTTNGVGGTGNWTTTGINWTTDPTGLAALVSGGWTNGFAWSNNLANNAILEGTAGTVSLSSSSIYANQILVNTTDFTIRNSSASTTSANRYFRTKSGIVLANGVNLNVSSGATTNGAITGFEGPITNAVGATNTSVTITGATLGADTSIRLGFDGTSADIWVPITVATTGSGYAYLRNVGSTNSIYGNITVGSGSILRAGASSTSRRINLRGNITTADSDLVIGDGTDPGIVGLYGTNAIAGNIIVNSGALGYGATNVFGTSTVILSNGTRFGQLSTIGTNAIEERTIAAKISILGDVTFGLGTHGCYFAGGIDLNGATRVITLSNSTTISGVISNGALTVTDTNGATRSLTLDAANAYTGATVISNGGRLAVSGSIASSASITAETGGGLGYANTNAFGTNAVVLKAGAFFGQIAGMGTNISERTIANNVNLQGDATFGFGTYGNYFGGGLDLGAVTNRNIYLSNSTTVSGVISNGGLVINDTVQSTNNQRTFTIASASTFSGPTVVAGGVVTNFPVVTTDFTTNTTNGVITTNRTTNLVSATYGPLLLVTGSIASPSVTVQTNAALAGTGSIAGGVTIEAGGELAPGNASAGPIAVSGSLSLAAGSTANMEIDSLVDYDRVTSSSASALNGTVNVTFTTNFTPAPGSFQLFTGTVSGSPTLTVPALADTNLVWVTNSFATTGAIGISNASVSLTPYGSWLTNYPALTGANTNGAADPDGDGFNNNLEFAFNGNPTVGTPSLLAVSNASGVANFRFVATTNGVSYQVQSTTDLSAGPWTNSPVSVTNAADQSGITPALSGYVRKSFSANATGKLFYRVAATITNQ